MHEWGDEWFRKHGETLNKAQEYIYTYVYKRTRYSVSMKEKYGTVRYEYLYPQPYYLSKYWHSWKVYQWIRRLQYNLAMRCLHTAIEKATKKWPEIKEEILEDSPFDDQSDPYWTKL